ncbi:NADH-quinone oxidoreductase subunit H [Fundidesulfovibrio magnetotacticus]|uniref:NADH-quinone oxidoreductase subunit H n=1 Tax=Fundidesulfovibrio magnetotacticus TaxID=2730080 RepID=A0A6V8LIL9_9BACT|nr:NADH-quinone oxidoreductase subunit NuoH [Fundidesulfovibrio magnetotacticus]GFK92563.1 NADH-quinone oxidoreductase subunit H [Fundidesulfovibrio magnetotacticus]
MSDFFAPEFVRLVLALVAIMGFVAANGMALLYVERKVAGHVQRRPGPFEVGPHGLLQALADAGKLVGKQLATPRGADALLFWTAPLMAFMPVPLMFIAMPFSENLWGLGTDLGLVLILSFAGFNVLALCLAGWASNNKWSLLGAARAVAQAVAYEIPLLLSVLAVAMLTGSLDLREVAAHQGAWPWQWNVFVQPLAFFIYFVCAVAETNRAPFDLAEAESELTAGVHTEYSGMGNGIIFLAEYANMLVVSCVATVLFLGGAAGPWAPGPWWFLAKMYALVTLIIFMRWTYPRVRFDQLLNLNWRWLMPLALVNLVLTAFCVKLWGGA